MNDKDFEKLVFGMAHQIRNPCAIILSNARVVLKKEALSPEAKRSLESIVNGVKYLEQRLDEFVEFSKPLALKLEVLSVQKLLQEAAAILKDQCELKRARISCNVEDNLTLKRADRNQLALAVLNVVLNAVESVKEGGGIQLEGKSEKGNAVITVRDDGAGIHPRDIPEVLSPFYSTKPNSIGIGLSVAKRIVLAHGGEISLASELGKGTIVTIHLPIGER